MSRAKVHVRDASGALVFTRLYDDGSNVLEFESGHGCVARDRVERERWQILPGWAPTTASVAQASA